MTRQSNILIVEDRSDWQDIVSSTVSAEGYSASAVSSYDSAMQALSKQKFDLAVIDPVLDTDRRINRDGLTVIQKINENQPGTPFVIITGSLTPDIQLTLQKLCPMAPVFFKESWNPAEFVLSLQQLMGEQTDEARALDTTPSKLVDAIPERVEPPIDPNGYPRILLVENNPDWQQIVGAVLNQTKCFWRVVATAQQALHELEHESFHVVVLDLKLQPNNLPLRSNEGWLLLDHIADSHPKVKVVVLSGKASAADVAHLLTDYSVIRFIDKQHFTSEIFQDAIDKATEVPELRIWTLGQFRLSRDGEVLGVWESPQIELLVKLLMIRRAQGERAVAADELIARLWPRSEDEEGRKKLLPTINRARHMLEPDIEPRDSNFILRSSNGYFFNLNERVHWDLMTFREYLNRGRELFAQKQWLEAKAELEKGQLLYRGDFLAEDRKIDWANDLRRQITSEYCDLMTHIADIYANMKQYGQAIEACETALRKDPLLEGVYRRLMQFYYCQGNKAQALKVFRNCIKLFEEIFGESPAEATLKLHQAILNDEPVDCF